MKKSVRNEFTVLAFVLVISGILLLFEVFGYLSGISRFWPIFPLIIGIGLLMLFQKQEDIGLLWLGSFLIINSILFFYLNFTSWKRLTKLWPLFITIFGTSSLLCYFSNKNKIILIISLFTIFLSIAFILIFGLSPQLWPVSLIIAGIFIYLVSRHNE
jgi:hypothetical protein